MMTVSQPVPSVLTVQGLPTEWVLDQPVREVWNETASFYSGLHQSLLHTEARVTFRNKSDHVWPRSEFSEDLSLHLQQIATSHYGPRGLRGRAAPSSLMSAFTPPFFIKFYPHCPSFHSLMHQESSCLREFSGPSSRNSLPDIHMAIVSFPVKPSLTSLSINVSTSSLSPHSNYHCWPLYWMITYADHLISLDCQLS